MADTDWLSDSELEKRGSLDSCCVCNSVRLEVACKRGRFSWTLKNGGQSLALNPVGFDGEEPRLNG